ncbi:MAG TPA: MMPL family transporter [Thermoanaerobaculia bacterium]|nr:MMPL family transporter [Thermoanaerobaculia bacterium]
MLSLARTALARPRLVLLLFLLGTVVVAAGLPRLELRTDGALLYPRGDATVEQTLADRDAFHEPERILVLVSARPGGPPVASAAGFRFLRRIFRELQGVPGIQAFGVRSLADLVEPPPPGKLEIRNFLDEVPDDPAAFAALLGRIRRLPLASGLFLSADGRHAPVYLSLAPTADRRVVLASLESWRTARVAHSQFTLRITGPAAAEAVLGEVVLADLARLVPLMVAAVALLLWLSLRTPGGVLIPLAQILATLLWTFGLMGWAGVPVTLVTTILPVLLMAMAMTDEVHLLVRVEYLLHRMPAEGDPRQRLRLATAESFAQLYAPLVLTSLTTAAGFFSFVGAAMASLRDLGWFAGVGLLLAMVFTFGLVPALMMVLPPGWSQRRRPPAASPADVSSQTAASRWERLLARRSYALALGASLLVAAALPGLFRLRVQDSWVDNFDPRSALVTAERDFNRSLWGTYRFDVVFQKDRRFFWTPQGMALLEDFDRLARQAPQVSGVLGPLDLLQVVAAGMGIPLPLSARAPLDLKRTGATLEVLSLRLDLRQLLTQDKDAARIRLFIRGADYAKGEALRRYLAPRVGALAARHGVRAHLSGDVPVGLAVVGAIVGNQLRSIAWTAVMIAVTLLVVFRSLRWTAVTLAPVLAATAFLFGVLGWAGLPLGIATSMFAALTLGAGVDFALHYVYVYRRERRAGRDHAAAVLTTLHTAGRSVLWNALVLACGFAVLAFSAIKPNASLGLLLAAAMLASYVSTVAFLPVLLARWGGEGTARGGPSRLEGKGT